MPGYVGTLLDIHDPDRFRDYLKGVGPSLAKYAGRSPGSSRESSTRARTLVSDLEQSSSR
jgi:uncharacterized protein (DUF1330 family)